MKVSSHSDNWFCTNVHHHEEQFGPSTTYGYVYLAGTSCPEMGTPHCSPASIKHNTDNKNKITMITNFF